MEEELVNGNFVGTVELEIEEFNGHEEGVVIEHEVLEDDEVEFHDEAEVEYQEEDKLEFQKHELEFQEEDELEFQEEDEVEFQELEYQEDGRQVEFQEEDEEKLADPDRQISDEEVSHEQEIGMEQEILNGDSININRKANINELEEEETTMEDSENRVVIFKAEGGNDSVITYTIPLSTSEEYNDEQKGNYQTFIIKDEHLLPNQSYQIIEGYLVPTNSNNESQPPPPSRKNNIIPCKPCIFTPDILRKKSLLQPDKLLIIYNCSFCQKAYDDFQSIKIHEAEHITVGDQVLMNANPQTNYLGAKLIPLSEFKFNCPYCFQGFTVSTELKRHVRKIHEWKSRLQKRKFTTQKLKNSKTLELLSTTLTVDTYGCNSCAELFADSDMCASHMANEHSTGGSIVLSVRPTGVNDRESIS